MNELVFYPGLNVFMQKAIRRRVLSTAFEITSPIHPLLQRIYAARGVQSERELQYPLLNLHKPNFKGSTDYFCRKIGSFKIESSYWW